MPEGNDPKEEVEVSWRPINFCIYSELFFSLAEDAAEYWLMDNQLKVETHMEVIFEHIVEHDGGGAVMGERFNPIHVEEQS